MQNLLTSFFETVAITFEVIGVTVMAVGFVLAVVLAIRSLIVSRDGRTAFEQGDQDDQAE